MNDKIRQIGCAITKCIFEICPMDYLETVFNGRLDIDDCVEQIILECIKYAFDNTQEKHSIRYFLKKCDSLSDDARMKYSRIMSLVQESKKKEIEYYKSLGIDLVDETEEMNDIFDKIQGYHISEMNFFEITNISEVELIKAIIHRRLMSAKKVPNAKFEEIAMQYDKFILSLKEQSMESDAKMVFNSLAFFTIEWKYGFNFLYRCIVEMDNNHINDVETLFSKMGMLLGYRQYMSVIGQRIATDSRMIGYREGLIKDFLLNPKIEYQYCEMLALVTRFKEGLEINGKAIKEWFIENTDIEDWASFLREYDIFKAADLKKEWTKEHIRNMRKLCAVVFPENRSYSEETEFDIMMSELKEDLQMDKLECYIEEYTNSEGKLCARLREKKSNKKIVMNGDLYEKKHLLRFLSLAKENQELMPTVFDRKGKDIVAVRGIKQTENDDIIEVNFDVIGAGYLFE